MFTSDFHFELPPDLIARRPAPERDQSRLMVLPRDGGPLQHRVFAELPALLRAGDLLVLNDSRVVPARLRGQREPGGGKFEVLLLEENGPGDWWVMLRPGKRVRPGSRLRFRSADGAPSPLAATVEAKNPEGWCRLRFEGVEDLRAALETHGEVPLPPYLHGGRPGNDPEDRTRYQTVYARHDGSVAAPTAGLHFTPALLDRIRGRGVTIAPLTLHVGHGTFAPVKTGRIADHVMHEERFTVSAETAEAWRRTRETGGRVIAVGTTCVRVLEHLARLNGGPVRAASGRTRIFLHPPAPFLAVDAMITNFHLPGSTLLMLVSAFAAPGETDRGRIRILDAYREAIRLRYRFYSYGDAMFIA
ncbi:MAG: tRNA preQ1(34) S-adenosylmethionine ribosyltransferase-isomerase QueA [Verrucomicrobiae bacterium]|nr:tRNA preQ1(34) S-adenosylmethionine ribosyltransferase-isomerase QueA [Verrucomicrobiae bacterium]